MIQNCLESLLFCSTLHEKIVSRGATNLTGMCNRELDTNTVCDTEGVGDSERPPPPNEASLINIQYITYDP